MVDATDREKEILDRLALLRAKLHQLERSGPGAAFAATATLSQIRGLERELKEAGRDA